MRCENTNRFSRPTTQLIFNQGRLRTRADNGKREGSMRVCVGGDYALPKRDFYQQFSDTY